MPRAFTGCLLATLVVAADPSQLGAQSPLTADSISREVDRLVTRALTAGLGPGLGVAVTWHGRIIHSRSYGFADATANIRADNETLWYLASTSKSITGFLVALLAHEGRLDLAAPITRLLPTARWPEGYPASTMTLAHFLSHTQRLSPGALVQQAAFVGEAPEHTWPELLQYSAVVPTTDLLYNNLGYNVAAMVIDRLEPEGWKALAERRLLRPAGMGNTFARVSGLDPRRIAKSHEVQPDGRFVSSPFAKADRTMNSAGGHLATLHDLARWTLVQMDSGRLDGRQVFPAAAVALSHRMIARQTREAARRFAFFDREGWGSGWDLGTYEGARMVSRFGGYDNLRSHLSFLPELRVGVVAMANSSLANGVTDIVAAMVYDLVGGRADAITRANERLDARIARRDTTLRSVADAARDRRARLGQSLSRDWDAYVGAYQAPGYGTIELAPSPDGMTYRWGVLSGPVEVVDAATERLHLNFAGVDATLTFRFPAEGRRAAAFTLNGVTYRRRDAL